MGESVAEGTIVRWLKKVGDPVERDEPLFEISTDKVDAEIPSPSAGVLSEIKVQEGETVPINTVVGVVDETAASEPRERPSASASATNAATADRSASKQAPAAAPPAAAAKPVAPKASAAPVAPVAPTAPSAPSHLRTRRTPPRAASPIASARHALAPSAPRLASRGRQPKRANCGSRQSSERSHVCITSMSETSPAVAAVVA